MFYLFEQVTVLTGKYKNHVGTVIDSNMTHIPTLYDVVMPNGVGIAMYENELKLFPDEVEGG